MSDKKEAPKPVDPIYEPDWVKKVKPSRPKK
jgi:hypothetical protein